MAEELIHDDGTRGLLDRMRDLGSNFVEVSAEVMARICDRDPPQGIVATFPLPMSRLESVPITCSDLVVVVDRLQDPGNVGAIIRTASAVGAAAVVLVSPCADPFDPKAVRGGMGAVFQVPVIETDEPVAVLARLRELGLRVVGSDHRGGEDPREALSGGVALLLGNEAHGLSSDLAAEESRRVTLPISGGAESLNVAVAAGILMYAWHWARPEVD